jgi:hypothetical protein
MHKLNPGQSRPKVWTISVIFKITKKADHPGVDVMMTIFSNFTLFSWRKIGVFLKNQYYDQIFAKTSSSLRKKR